jgi:hypothetical protein
MPKLKMFNVSPLRCPRANFEDTKQGEGLEKAEERRHIHKHLQELRE